MSRSRMLAFAATVSIVAAAFGAVPVAAQDEAPQPPTATPNPVALDAPAGDGTAVRLGTDLGDIVIGLFNESAPVAAENFVNLAEAGYYDGIGFHRVVEDFVIQGGDPNGDGTGGPGYGILDEEVVGDYGRGIVAMARTQAPNSQGSQFFIVTDDNAIPALESANTYVIFGRVLEGMDVVDAIAAEAIAAQGPNVGVVEDMVRIGSATIEEVELPPEPTSAPLSEAQIAADELAELIPDEVGGLVLDGSVFTSDQILPGSAEDAAILELTSIAKAQGAKISNLSIASAGGSDGGESFATILASSIPGVPAELIKEPLIQLILGGTGDAEVTEEVIGGHDVTLFTASPEEGDSDDIRVLVDGDVVWFVVADADSVEDVIAALPLSGS